MPQSLVCSRRWARWTLLALAELSLASRAQDNYMPALDLNFSPNWEFNVGVGVGLTRSTDDLLVKLILGRRF